MKPTTILVAALASVASATGLSWAAKCEKYKCFTLESHENWNPPCARPCYHANLGNSMDGCAADDFRCHCRNAQSIASVMRACLESQATGCTDGDRRAIGANLGEMCGYFNQTGYEAYRDCGNLLFSFVTYQEKKADDQALKEAVKESERLAGLL